MMNIFTGYTLFHVKYVFACFLGSGEKNHDITWPKIIEIKGRVKLDAFEKFVQELRRCQTRSLMVRLFLVFSSILADILINL